MRRELKRNRQLVGGIQMFSCQEVDCTELTILGICLLLSLLLQRSTENARNISRPFQIFQHQEGWFSVWLRDQNVLFYGASIKPLASFSLVTSTNIIGMMIHMIQNRSVYLVFRNHAPGTGRPKQGPGSLSVGCAAQAPSVEAFYEKHGGRVRERAMHLCAKILSKHYATPIFYDFFLQSIWAVHVFKGIAQGVWSILSLALHWCKFYQLVGWGLGSLSGHSKPVALHLSAGRKRYPKIIQRVQKVMNVVWERHHITQIISCNDLQNLWERLVQHDATADTTWYDTTKLPVHLSQKVLKTSRNEKAQLVSY